MIDLKPENRGHLSVPYLPKPGPPAWESREETLARAPQGAPRCPRCDTPCGTCRSSRP